MKGVGDLRSTSPTGLYPYVTLDKRNRGSSLSPNTQETRLRGPIRNRGLGTSNRVGRGFTTFYGDANTVNPSHTVTLRFTRGTLFRCYLR